MFIDMRTTLVLDDSLLKQAKRRAAERNTTVSEVVNDALRASLDRPQPTAPPFALVTYGRGAPRVRHEPTDFHRELEADDRARVR